MSAVGRNARCPCGSGRKYKNCCLPAKQAKEGELVRRRKASPEKRLLFVFPGKMGDALFALPTLKASARMAKASGIEKITWLTRPYTMPIAPVIQAGLGALGRRVTFQALDGNPTQPPSRREESGPANPAPPMGADWGDWSAKDWVEIVPGHDACVNASMQGPPIGDTHLTRHISLCAGISLYPERIALERGPVIDLCPDAPEGAVVFQPTCSEPEKTPIDLVYAKLPRGTIVVRGSSDPGLPEAILRRQGFASDWRYEEWVDPPLERLAATIARARLVVGVSSLIPVLGAYLGVPSIMVHQITTPEQCGITPWGGHDVMNPRDQGSLEELFERCLGDEYVRREEGRVPLLR